MCKANKLADWITLEEAKSWDVNLLGDFDCFSIFLFYT